MSSRAPQVDNAINACQHIYRHNYMIFGDIQKYNTMIYALKLTTSCSTSQYGDYNCLCGQFTQKKKNGTL